MQQTKSRESIYIAVIVVLVIALAAAVWAWHDSKTKLTTSSAQWDLGQYESQIQAACEDVSTPVGRNICSDKLDELRQFIQLYQSDLVKLGSQSTSTNP